MEDRRTVPISPRMSSESDTGRKVVIGKIVQSELFLPQNSFEIHRNAVNSLGFEGRDDNDHASHAKSQETNTEDQCIRLESHDSFESSSSTAEVVHTDPETFFAAAESKIMELQERDNDNDGYDDSINGSDEISKQNTAGNNTTSVESEDNNIEQASFPGSLVLEADNGSLSTESESTVASNAEEEEMCSSRVEFVTTDMDKNTVDENTNSDTTTENIHTSQNKPTSHDNNLLSPESERINESVSEDSGIQTRKVDIILDTTKFHQRLDIECSHNIQDETYTEALAQKEISEDEDQPGRIIQESGSASLNSVLRTVKSFGFSEESRELNNSEQQTRQSFDLSEESRQLHRENVDGVRTSVDNDVNRESPTIVKQLGRESANDGLILDNGDRAGVQSNSEDENGESPKIIEQVGRASSNDDLSLDTGDRAVAPSNSEDENRESPTIIEQHNKDSLHDDLSLDSGDRAVEQSTSSSLSVGQEENNGEEYRENADEEDENSEDDLTREERSDAGHNDENSQMQGIQIQETEQIIQQIHEAVDIERADVQEINEDQVRKWASIFRTNNRPTVAGGLSPDQTATTNAAERGNERSHLIGSSRQLLTGLSRELAKIDENSNTFELSQSRARIVDGLYGLEEISRDHSELSASVSAFDQSSELAVDSSNQARSASWYQRNDERRVSWGGLDSSLEEAEVRRPGAVSVSGPHIESETFELLRHRSEPILEAQLVDEDEMEVRVQQMVNESLEAQNVPTTLAEVVCVEETQSQSEADKSSKFCLRNRFVCCFGLFLTISLVVVVALTLGISDSRSTSTPSTQTTPSETIEPFTGLPLTSVEQLYDAVDDYMDNGVRQSIVARTYGYPIGAWDVSQVSNFSHVFDVTRNKLAAKFNDDISAWDVRSATVMKYMFSGAAAFNQSISKWDVSRVVNMAWLFGGASSFDVDISSWNVSSVTTMYALFQKAGAFNRDISPWDVSSVTDMGFMFSETTRFNSDISSWDVSATNNMRGMFQGGAFNRTLSPWDTSRCTDMGWMFNKASDFNGDISSWNVSAVKDMTVMFQKATSFNIDLSSWDVSRVEDMRWMLYGASAFNGNISTWDTRSLTSTRSMFNDAAAFDGNLESWNVSGVTSMRGMFQSATSFRGEGISSWDVSSVIQMNYMFKDAPNFNGNVSTWNTHSVTDMGWMFFDATSFEADLSSWDVSAVRKMPNMFHGASRFNSNIADWKPSKVWDTRNMFRNASEFSQNLCPWGEVFILSKARVQGMFDLSGCPTSDDPSSAVSPPGPFCYSCGSQ